MDGGRMADTQEGGTFEARSSLIVHLSLWNTAVPAMANEQ
jgi:hypothetical protein